LKTALPVSGFFWRGLNWHLIIECKRLPVIRFLTWMPPTAHF
jgi:hypothetical protein